MSLADAPQWLVSAFVRSAVAVGARAGREEIQRTARALVERWQEPERKFHNLRHLIDVLARVEELAEETHGPHIVRLAAWYHGAVFNASPQVAYARRGGEDEVASAELARTELAALGVPADVVGRVAELILDLARHDADERDVDALALCDADLGTLAVEPQRYAAYRRAIREEYAHIPEEDYVSSRIAILTRLLQRRRLFVSPFSLAWEEPARENLTAELSHLRGRLAAIGGTEPPSAAGAVRPGGAAPTSWPSRVPAARPDDRARPEPGGRGVPAMERADGASPAGHGEADVTPLRATASHTPASPPSEARPTASGARPAGAEPADGDAPSSTGGASHDVAPSPDGATSHDGAPSHTGAAAPDGAASPAVVPSTDGATTPDAAAEREPERRTVVTEPDGALSGIEREPGFEVRRKARSKRRRDHAAAQFPDDAAESPGSLFRPPPKLPRS